MKRYYPPTEDQQNSSNSSQNLQPPNVQQTTTFPQSVPGNFVPTKFATASVPSGSTTSNANFVNPVQLASSSTSAPPTTTPPTEPPVEAPTDHHNPNLGLHGKKRVYFTNPEDQTSYEEHSYTGQSTQASSVPTHPNQLAQGVQNMNLGSAPISNNAYGYQQPTTSTSSTGTTTPSGEAIPLSVGANVQCPPLYMRMSLNAIPNSTNLLNKAGIPFGVVIHPLAQAQTKEVCYLILFLANIQ